jgi:UDP-galactose transporter B1
VKQTTKKINPLVKGARPSMHESMLWTNVSGCLVALALALITGHLFNGIRFCSDHPPVRYR